MDNSGTRTWFALEIAAEPEAAEAVEYALNSLDSLGTEINYLRKTNADLVTVVGYFNEPPNDEGLRAELHYALRMYDLDEEAIRSVTLREVENADWLQEWKKRWKPTEIGRFVIAPPWESVDRAGAIVIRIEPNMAFGTGTHETTQLCLKSIEANYVPGDSFLDVGTGTGILAIAAARLAIEGTENTEKGVFPVRSSPPSDSNSAAFSVPSVAQILACDTDLDSIKIARDNADLNGVGGSIEFIRSPLPEDAPTFDFVCANLTLDAIVPVLPLLLAKTRKTLVLSGVLDEQEDVIVRSLVGHGVSKYRIEQAGEWIAVTVATEET